MYSAMNPLTIGEPQLRHLWFSVEKISLLNNIIFFYFIYFSLKKVRGELKTKFILFFSFAKRLNEDGHANKDDYMDLKGSQEPNVHIPKYKLFYQSLSLADSMHTMYI